jgi:hypothetical protein
MWRLSGILAAAKSERREIDVAVFGPRLTLRAEGVYLRNKYGSGLLS